MKNNYDGKVKGHGYFRKTKAFGLASGIVLGAALIFGAGSVSADEVNTPATATTTSTSQDDNVNFENRQEVNKIINNQTPSNTPDANDTLNSQIKSVETIPSTTADATRYKVELHDGYTIGDNGKLTFYVNNSEIREVTDAIKDKDNGKVLGSINVSKVGVDEQNKITNELNNASTFKEFSDIIKQTPNNKITGLGKVTISLSKAFAEKNKNRVIEFELYNPYGENPRSLSSLLNKDFKPLNALANDAKNATEVLKNTFSAPEFSGPKTIAGVNSRVERGALILPSVNNQKLSGPASYLGVYLREVNKMVPHELAINVLTSSVQKEPSNTPNIKGLRSISIGFPASIASLGETYEKGYPSNLLGAQEEGKTFIKKGDEINFSLTEDSILKFSSTLKPGDELEFVLETEKDGNGAGGTRFTDSNVFVNADGKTVNLPEKNVKFKVTSVGEKSISLSSMEDVTVKAGHRYTLTPTNVLSYTDLYFNDNWANSKFGNKLVELFKNKDAGAYTQLDPKDHPEIAIRLSYLRDGKVISSNVPYSEVKKDVNSIIGENSTGTVKVRYVDEAGKEIPGQKTETIAENKPWDTVVTITPKSIDGYTFVKSSVPLKTLVGSGEQVVDLVYKLINKTTNPLDPNANTPIEETVIKEYKPNPKLDPGTQNIVDPGKPRKTQGDKVVDPGKPQVIEVGTKPKVVEEEIPFEKKTRENPNLPEGTSKVVQEGKNGKKKTTTTYTLDPKTGKVTPNTPTVETTPPVDQITEIGKGKDKDGDLVVNYIPDPESPQGKETIVDEGSKPKLDVTGKVKDPGKPKVIKVGTKPKVVEEEIPFEKKIRENPNLPEGTSKVVQEGKNGKKKTTTTYTLDPKTGKVTPNTPTVETTPPVDQITEIGKGKDKDGDLVVNYIPDPESPQGKETIVDEGSKPKLDVTGKVKDPGKPKVIKVGTKPKVVEEEIPFEKKIRENPNLPEGTSKVVQEGKNGKKKTTTTYTLDPKTGKVTPNTPTVETTPPVDQITEIGKGKDKDGDLVVNYIPDPESPQGNETIVDEGSKPKLDITGKVKDPGKPKVIKVGTKPKVVEEEIPFKETVVENPSKPEGSRTVLKEGKVGKKTTTTTYTLDPKTGKVTPNTTTSTTPPEDRLIEVGTGKNVDGDIVTEYVPDLELEPGQTKVVQNGTPEVKDVTGKVVTPGTPTIIHIGIKPKVVEENIPFEREYKDNPKLPEGVENVIQKGVNGKKVTTTTYTVDTKTGKVTSTDKVDETPVVNEIVERGTGKNITGEIVVNYVPDPELEPGKTKVVQEGTPEVKDVTGKVVTPGKPTIIHVGTKPKVVEEETPFKEETRENKDLPKGQTKVVQEGKVGKKTTTTTYEVDPKTGTVTPTEKVEETPAVNKITEIGTKEEAKPAPTPTSQTPAKPQVQEVKKQLPSTGSATSVALTLAGLSVMGLAATMVLKKKEQ